MNGRERVLTAMRRKVPDRVPKTFSLCPSQLERFHVETGAEDPAEYFGFEVRSLSVLPTRLTTDFAPWLGDVSGMRVDEWGIAWQRTESSMHFEKMIHPLRDAGSVADIEEYPFPDLDADYRYEGVAHRIAQLQESGLAVSAHVAPLGGTIFWPPYKLRGMERLLMDMYDGSPVADALFDRVTDLCCTMAARLAGLGADIIHTADDLGTQKGLFVGIEMYRRWFKERMRRVVRAAKDANPDVLVFMHSDGDIHEIIPDLIEIGIDILNPLQPECMDIAGIKNRFGGDLAFWGGVGTQTTMPFGSPDDVDSCVRELIDTIGRGGGFLIAPTHLIEPEVPWENIMSFINAVEKYGGY